MKRDKTPIRYTAQLTDAWRSGDGGWEANCAWSKQTEGVYTSVVTAMRELKRTLGINNVIFDLLYDDGATRRYKQRGAAILLFITAEAA